MSLVTRSTRLRLVAVALLTMLAVAWSPGVAQALGVALESGGSERVVSGVVDEVAPQVIGEVGGAELVSPSPRAILAGYHQATIGGMQPMTPVEASDGDPTAVDILASRGRATHPTSALDVALPVDESVLAVVTGEVRAVSNYQLYGTTQDVVIVIVPDDAPHLEVKVLHVESPQVEAGDVVVAGETVIADRGRLLPFPSQIDRVIGEQLPHVHVEVVARG